MQTQGAINKQVHPSSRFWKEHRTRINHSIEGGIEAVPSALMNFKRERMEVLTFVGILQPTSRQDQRTYKYQLLTDEALLYLDAPKELVKLFDRHAWERFFIKGSYSANNVVCVKAARLENEDVPAVYDFGKPFDLEFYRRMIDHGFSLEPKLEEIA